MLEWPLGLRQLFLQKRNGRGQIVKGMYKTVLKWGTGSFTREKIGGRWQLFITSMTYSRYLFVQYYHVCLQTCNITSKKHEDEMKPHFLILALLGSSSEVSSVAASSCSCLTITIHTQTKTLVLRTDGLDRGVENQQVIQNRWHRSSEDVTRGSTIMMSLALKGLRIDMTAFVLNQILLQSLLQCLN